MTGVPQYRKTGYRRPGTEPKNQSHRLWSAAASTPLWRGVMPKVQAGRPHHKKSGVTVAGLQSHGHPGKRRGCCGREMRDVPGTKVLRAKPFCRYCEIGRKARRFWR